MIANFFIIIATPLRGITPLFPDWPPSLLGVNPAGGTFRKGGREKGGCTVMNRYIGTFNKSMENNPLMRVILVRAS